MGVAFCHSKRGEREDQDADRLLEKVVEAVSSHRRRRLSQVEASTSVSIMDEVATLFEETSRTPLSGQEAEERMEAIFGAHGLGLTEAGLEKLDVDADEIIKLKGPRNAAAEIVGKVMETSPRQMFYRQKQNFPTLTPVAYGSRPGRRGLLRFALEVLGVPSANIESVIQGEIQAEKERANEDKETQEGVSTNAKPKDG